MFARKFAWTGHFRNAVRVGSECLWGVRLKAWSAMQVLAVHCVLQRYSDIVASTGSYLPCPLSIQGSAAAYPYTCSSTASCTLLQRLWGSKAHTQACTHTRSHTSAHTHTHTYARTHGHTHTHTDTITHRHANTHTHAQTHKQTCTHTDTCTNTHTHTRARTHTRTNTQTHTHTHTRARTHARIHAYVHTRDVIHQCFNIASDAFLLVNNECGEWLLLERGD